MVYSEELAQRMRDVLISTPDLVEKKMFGGIGFMVRGNMACGVNKDDLIVRVGPEGYQEALDQPHTKPFDITGKPMKGWVMVEQAGLTDTDLKEWLQKAKRFVETLPSK